MRDEATMLDLILNFAKEDEHVRIVSLEGSRVPPIAPRDPFQDYDITFIVTEMASFLENDLWLDVFGKRIFMQKPEAMSLFPPEFGDWFSYLMLFEDGNRIDLTLIPLNEMDDYIHGDENYRILLDKDNLVLNHTHINNPFYIRKPSEAEFDDCCNEFWWISTYIVKGICRNEFLYAAEFMNQILRKELLRMIAWKVGVETNFSVSVGKNYRYLEAYVSDKLWVELIATYSQSSYDDLKAALFKCLEIFREVSSEVAVKLNYKYPEYDEQITKYIARLFEDQL